MNIPHVAASPSTIGIRESSAIRQSVMKRYMITTSGAARLLVNSGTMCASVVSMLSTRSTIMFLKLPEDVSLTYPSGTLAKLIEALPPDAGQDCESRLVGACCGNTVQQLRQQKGYCHQHRLYYIKSHFTFTIQDMRHDITYQEIRYDPEQNIDESQYHAEDVISFTLSGPLDDPLYLGSFFSVFHLWPPCDFEVSKL